MKTLVVYEPWRIEPLAWIHRGEARALAAELHGAGHDVGLMCMRRQMAPPPPGTRLLLRLSDPTMAVTTRALRTAGIDYVGPAADAMDRCYDKHTATRLALDAGIDCPATALASESGTLAPPRILKPRRGSDSIGLRLLGSRAVPIRLRTSDHVVQSHVPGRELTVGVLQGAVGAPLHIELPRGVPYSFLRKYVARPARTTVREGALVSRVRSLAEKLVSLFSVDWAARIDLIHDAGNDRLYFLECDVVPLVGAGSAFAQSMAAAGIDRSCQLRMLLGEGT